MKIEVTREEPVQPPVKAVALTLNPVEAADLKALCGVLCGTGANIQISDNFRALAERNIRVTTDALYEALKRNGV